MHNARVPTGLRMGCLLNAKRNALLGKALWLGEGGWHHACKTDSRMKSQLKLSVLFAFLFGLMFSGCRTMEGAGKDIQKGGEKLEDAAQKANR